MRAVMDRVDLACAHLRIAAMSHSCGIAPRSAGGGGNPPEMAAVEAGLEEERRGRAGGRHHSGAQVAHLTRPKLL